MGDPRELGAGAAPRRPAQLFAAEVLDDATAEDQPVRCNRGGRATDPLPWDACVRGSGHYWPKRGDSAVVAYPVGGPPYIDFWQPSAGATPDA